jgi:diguanylate cyclase (GGDEF)-like protein
MNEATQVFQERMDQLRRDYASQLPNRLNEIESTAKTLNSVLSIGDRHISITQLREYSHKLAGSGATFGFPDISDIAKILEQVAKSLLTQDAEASPQSIDQILSLVADLNDAGRDILPKPEQLPAAPAPPTPLDLISNRLILIEPDPAQADRITTGLSNFGYALETLSSTSQFPESLKQGTVLAVIWDIDYFGGDRAEATLLQSFNGGGSENIPLIFLSENSSTKARLDAVRAGCNAYVMKPFNAAEFVDILDECTNQKETAPYRILIVDDDLNMADYNKLVLEQAGMVVKTVSDPMRLLEEIRDFSPELILMDLYMHGCTGGELATVIRQNTTFVGIPIVFLSSEIELDSQLNALSHGGDDFLEKSINPSQLVEALSIRARRFRSLSLQMLQDSLTGLLNHTSTKQALDTEIFRARRNNQVVSFAMLDIDHFKSVNDTYGHLAGDWVIKSLARMLKQGLRSGDIVGRVGGEEFAVILPGADGETAKGVIEKIRLGFLEMEHQSEDGEFYCTLSGGVATFPQSSSAMSLTNTADQCLYEAKKGGRNQIILQNPIEPKT